MENFAAEGTNISSRKWWRSKSEQKDGGFYTSNQMFTWQCLLQPKVESFFQQKRSNFVLQTLMKPVKTKQMIKMKVRNKSWAEVGWWIACNLYRLVLWAFVAFHCRLRVEIFYPFFLFSNVTWPSFKIVVEETWLLVNCMGMTGADSCYILLAIN